MTVFDVNKEVKWVLKPVKIDFRDEIFIFDIIMTNFRLFIDREKFFKNLASYYLTR